VSADETPRNRLLSLINRRAPSPSLEPGVKYALSVFVVMRLAISLWVALVLIVTQPPTSPDDLLRPYQGVEPISGGAHEFLVGAWQRFDTLWYLRIAEHGYALDDGSTVYFPLYPMLTGVLGRALLGNFLVAALVISSVAYIVALFCLYKLTEAELGRAAARRGTLYLALFPTSFFFLAAYTESLFLALTLASFLFASRTRWWSAGIVGFLASLTRLQGIVLIVPFVYMYLRERGFRLKRVRLDLLGLLIIPCGALLFLAYQQVIVGSPGLADVYQGQLHAQFVWPWANVLATLAKIISSQGTFINVLNLSLAGVFLAMTVVTFRSLPREYGIYMAVTMLVLLLRRTTLQPLVSMSRYVLILFPAFMLWGRWGRNPRVQRLIVYPSMALLLYLSGQFAMWGWVA
jgi:hypothetical protein